MKTCALLICCALMIMAGSQALRSEPTQGPELVLPLNLPLQIEDALEALPDVTLLTVPAADPANPDRYLCPTQFRVWIPDNAIKLAIEVESGADRDRVVHLYIRYGSPITEDDEFVYFSAAAVGPDHVKRIELSDASEPPLRAGPLFLALGTLAEQDAPVTIRLGCIVSELPEGAEGAPYGLLNIPYLLVTVPNALCVSIPVGWVPLPDERLAPGTLAAFETPRVEGQPTAGRLEISTWNLTEVSEVDELRSRLEAIYSGQGKQQVVAQGALVIDGRDARKSFLIDNSSSSATLFACFISDGAAWLLSVTFAPLGYGEMYERIFESAVATLRLDLGEDREHPDSSE